MLRVHFTDRDLARTVVAATPDPLWETVLGMHQLAGGSPALGAWRSSTRAEIVRRALTAPLRYLHALAPPTGYFPDFLTPAEAEAGLRSGLDAVRGTPRGRLRVEISKAALDRSLPPWAGELAAGERTRLDEVRSALGLLHDVLVAPAGEAIEATFDAERDRRAEALLRGGVAAMLDSLGPGTRWDPPVLSCAYPVERDLRLDGRGIRLVPSYFCWGSPVALADTTLDQVLVYPARPVESAERRRNGSDTLGALLGRTRARVLEGLRTGASTSELASRIGISVASGSEHLTVLRDAGLVRSRRAGQQVRHHVTPTGRRLLEAVSD